MQLVAASIGIKIRTLRQIGLPSRSAPRPTSPSRGKGSLLLILPSFLCDSSTALPPPPFQGSTLAAMFPEGNPPHVEVTRLLWKDDADKIQHKEWRNQEKCSPPRHFSKNTLEDFKHIDDSLREGDLWIRP